jgi:hypothetical protein
MAFVPWGYYAGRRLGSGSKFILAVFFTLVLLALSIRAIVDREWDTVWIPLIGAALSALAAYVNWPDWNLKLRRTQSVEPSNASKIAEDVFGCRPLSENKKKSTQEL